MTSPVETGDFLDQYWGKLPGLFREGDRRALADVLAVERFDEMLQFCPIKLEHIGLERNGEVQAGHQFRKADGGLDVSRLRDAYGAGDTLIVRSLEQYWIPVLSVCRTLEQVLGSKVSSQVVLSSLSVRSVAPVLAVAELFVLQTHGASTWRIHPPFSAQDGEAAVSLEATLEPGEVLYIPGGWAYAAAPCTLTSLQVVFAVEPFRWADLLACAIRAVAQRDERFRRALPVGWSSQPDVAAQVESQFAFLVQVLQEQVQVRECASRLSQEFIESLASLPDDRFCQFERLAALDADTPISKRTGTICCVRWESEAVTISFPGGRLKGPLHIGPALEYIVREEKFSAGSLPGLDLQRGLVLIRDLVRRGLLRCE